MWWEGGKKTTEARSIVGCGPIFRGQLGHTHELKGQGINIWRAIHL